MKIKQPILLFVEFLKSETTGLLHIKKFDIDSAFPESFGYVLYDEYCRVVESLQKKNDELIRLIELAGEALEDAEGYSFGNATQQEHEARRNALSEIRKLKGE